ncbi:hypothetical protein DIZ27_23765 [Streptomyces sp. NWU339]|nr:hypothetical protein DIZ27_23765 [Streptomyces sp. NWU339]
MLEFLQSCRLRVCGIRGCYCRPRGWGRCSRDEISPHPQGGSQRPELSFHHAVEPGVNAPANVDGAGLGQRSTNRDTRERERPQKRRGHHAPPPLSTPSEVVNITGEPGRAVPEFTSR